MLNAQIFGLPNNWLIKQTDFYKTRTLITLSSDKKIGSCPICNNVSSELHSYKERFIQHTPFLGKPLDLKFILRKWRCVNSCCNRKTFTESLSFFVDIKQRASKDLIKMQTDIALISGGKAGKRIMEVIGVRTSNDTLIRRIMKIPSPKINQFTHIGIDDWAFRKGHRYGTVIIDLMTNKPIDLLPDRTVATVSKWLKQHPEIEVISRDRSSAYAKAARESSPRAIQIADRWHLLKNIKETIDKVLFHYKKEIENLITNNLTALQKNSNSINEIDVVDWSYSNSLETSYEEKKAEEIQEIKSRNEPKYNERYERWLEVKKLYDNGLSIREIARKTGIHRVTIRKYIKAEEFIYYSSRTQKSYLMENWIDYLSVKIKDGIKNATLIWKEMCGLGFKGSVTTVRSFVAKMKKKLIQKINKQAIKRPSIKTVSIWLMTANNEDNFAYTLIRKLCQAHVELKVVRELVLKFKKMLELKDNSNFVQWLSCMENSEFSEIQSLAKSMGQDFDAINAAIKEKWSNGVVEGHVNRIKMLKRQMYGRANIDLIKKRVMSCFS